MDGAADQDFLSADDGTDGAAKVCGLAASCLCVTTGEQPQPHSAEWFGELRDHWWNHDQLQLIATRVRLANVQRVLDVGCGVGHWAFVVTSLLPPDVRLIGMDREPDWVREATRRAERYGLDGRVSFREGDAAALEFDEASFDLVTCQTLLIHVPDPQAVIGEMLRVTKPGGLLLVSEPNNIASFLVRSSANADASVEETLDLLRFVLTCEGG
jgi:ubiquinone/menaquinone biosynthesis C-methylase UbiE